MSVSPGNLLHLPSIEAERARRRQGIDPLVDPERWFADCLDCKIYPKQAAMILAVRDHEQVSTVGCNSSGKDWTAARIALWWMASHKPAKVIITGPSYRQVKEVVWQELRSAYLDAKVELGGQLYETPLLRWDEESFVYGFSTDKPYKLQGFHSPALFIIVTEAHGMAQNHIDALWRLNPNNMLMTGNPISESGEFYESHHGKAHLWQTINIDAWDTPNVIEGRQVIPGLVTLEDIERGKRNWGEDSPLFKMTYKNEWVEGMGRLVVVPLSWAQAAERAHYEPGQIEVIGVDVARGGQDNSVIYSRRGRVARLLYRVNGHNTMEIAGYVKGYHDKHKQAHVVVDGVGVGGGVVDRLRELGIGIIDFQGGSSAEDSSHFVNRTAEVWWRMRKAYEAGLDVEEDSLLRGEVSSRRYEIQSDKRIKLESKDDMKAEGRHSPDSADALSMSYCLDWQVDGNRLSAGSDVNLDELDPGLEEDYAKKQQHMTLDLGRGSDMAPYRASRWGKIRSRR